MSGINFPEVRTKDPHRRSAEAICPKGRQRPTPRVRRRVPSALLREGHWAPSAPFGRGAGPPAPPSGGALGPRRPLLGEALGPQRPLWEGLWVHVAPFGRGVGLPEASSRRDAGPPAPSFRGDAGPQCASLKEVMGSQGPPLGGTPGPQRPTLGEVLGSQRPSRGTDRDPTELPFMSGAGAAATVFSSVSGHPTPLLRKQPLRSSAPSTKRGAGALGRIAPSVTAGRRIPQSRLNTWWNPESRTLFFW